MIWAGLTSESFTWANVWAPVQVLATEKSKAMVRSALKSPPPVIGEVVEISLEDGTPVALVK